MVLIRYIWCDLWHAQLPVIRERLGLPVLDLDLGDEADSRDRIMTRIGAFMEMLA
jgi:benzoyl-CoA reductase/2-hydroxyglutaryl-CoA dehydratase subunit BcrC/BadD/HgdB